MGRRFFFVGLDPPRPWFENAGTAARLRDGGCKERATKEAPDKICMYIIST